MSEGKEMSRRDFLKTGGKLVACSFFLAKKIKGATPIELQEKESKEQRGDLELRINAIDAYNRINRYAQERIAAGKYMEINDDPQEPQNILARVMMSEERRHPKQWHLAILIAWTVLNRVTNNLGKNMTTSNKIKYLKQLEPTRLKQMINYEVTHGHGFGPQGIERPYASVYDPLPTDERSGYYRLFADAILNGVFNDYDFNQVNFFHVQAQQAEHAKNPNLYKSPDKVIEQWTKNGKLEETLSVRGYVNFYKIKDTN